MEIRFCKQCNEVLENKKHRNVFCNRSCSGKYNNSRRKVIVLCEVCRAQIHNPKGKRRFCSKGCESKSKKELTKTKIENGKSTHPQTIKRHLIDKRGSVCEVCGNTIWMDKPIPLVMDHIDGNSGNNQLSNLRLVCGNCDMQLPTYKSKNRGNGRAFRRQRYADGKSY